MNKLFITSKKNSHIQARKFQSTHMHKLFLGKNMILFVIGWRSETLWNIWMLFCWMFKIIMLSEFCCSSMEVYYHLSKLIDSLGVNLGLQFIIDLFNSLN
jgi:hypothetical protein